LILFSHLKVPIAKTKMGFGAEDALFNSTLDFNLRKELVSVTFGA
jgi:hypothetical protein